jgi:hypothetical protein
LLEVAKRLKEYDVQQNLIESIGKEQGPRIPPDAHIDSPPPRDEDISEESSNLSVGDSSVALSSSLSDPPRDDLPEIPLESTKIVIGSPVKPHVFTKHTSARSGRKEDRKSGDLNIVKSGTMPQIAENSIVVPTPVAVGIIT